MESCTHMSFTHALDFHCILDCFATSQWRRIRDELSLGVLREGGQINSTIAKLVLHRGIIIPKIGLKYVSL